MKKTDPKTNKKSVSPPTTPSRVSLPFRQLTFEEFEVFSTDFVSVLPGVKNAHRYGKQGDTQEGIDLFAKKTDGKTDTYQCRNYERITKGQFETTVKETKYKAESYTILTAGIATPEARKECGNFPGWDIWDSDDISREIRKLPLEQARTLIRTHFGTQWIASFLNIPEVTAFTSPERYFKDLLDKKRIFSHSTKLVARDQTLADLQKFITKENLKVGVIVGRGGIGKSRILLEFAEQLRSKNAAWNIKFAEEDIELQPDMMADIPADPTIIVVDDAHRRENEIGTLLSFAKQCGTPVKLLFSTRPQAIELLLSEMTQHGLERKEILVFDEIKELSTKETKELSAQILTGNKRQLIDRLSQVTKDSPLLTVLSARLIESGIVATEHLNNDENFRTMILDRFQEEISGNFSDVLTKQQWRKLIELIPAIQPLHDRDDKFYETVSEYLSIDKSTLHRALAELESSGFLIRRGYLMRITPDVLADHLLERASFVKENDTGYFDEVFSRFSELKFGLLLKNFGELDWKKRQRGYSGPSLLERAWKNINERFENASNWERCEILKEVKEAAYYQPKEVLSLIEYAISNKATAPEPKEIPDKYGYKHVDVLEKLPELLQRIAYTLELLPRVCDLLWELGRDDKRLTNPHPEHAMRVLCDLAGFDIGKSVEVNDVVLNQVEKWLSQQDVHTHKHSPLDVIDPMLSRDSFSSFYEDGKIVFTPFLVHQKNTTDIRKKALRILFTLINNSKDSRVVLRALKSIVHALSEPRGYFNLVISQEALQQWLPDQMQILEQLEKSLPNISHPMCHFEVLETLYWHARHSSYDDVKKKAQSIIDKIPNTDEHDLYRAIWRGHDPIWFTEPDDSVSFDDRRKEGDLFRVKIAEKFTKDFPDPKKALQKINAILEDLEHLGEIPNPSAFLIKLAEANPNYGKVIFKEIVEQEENAVTDYTNCLLIGIEISGTDIASLIKEAFAKNIREKFTRSIAHYYHWREWKSPIESDHLQILTSLLIHPDTRTKLGAVSGLMRLGKVHTDEAKKLALSVDVGKDGELLEELVDIFDDQYGIPWDKVSDEEMESIIGKSYEVESLDKHPITVFLEKASERAPQAVIKMLLYRIHVDDDIDFDSFRSLPHKLKVAIAKNGNDYKQMLRDVRDGVLQDGWRAQVYIPQLFGVLSNGYDDDSIAVLNEWVESRDERKIIAASSLLQKAPNSFVFTHAAFIKHLFEEAQKVSKKALKEVRSDLFFSAILGERSGTVGAPMPQDVELRDKAEVEKSKHEVHSIMYEFYDSLHTQAEKRIRDTQAEHEQLLGS